MKWEVYANSFNLELTRIPNGQTQIDSSTILQRFFFVQEFSPVQGITTSQKQ